MFEAKNSSSTAIIRKGVDTNRKIVKIMVYLKYGEMLTALKLIDSEGQSALIAEWGLVESGEWVTQTIPEGKEIIGMYCRTEYMTIEKLGFIVWTPNCNALETYTGLKEELQSS